jgi:hypothetical protein
MSSRAFSGRDIRGREVTAKRLVRRNQCEGRRPAQNNEPRPEYQSRSRWVEMRAKKSVGGSVSVRESACGGYWSGDGESARLRFVEGAEYGAGVSRARTASFCGATDGRAADGGWGLVLGAMAGRGQGSSG